MGFQNYDHANSEIDWADRNDGGTEFDAPDLLAGLYRVLFDYFQTASGDERRELHDRLAIESLLDGLDAARIGRLKQIRSGEKYRDGLPIVAVTLVNPKVSISLGSKNQQRRSRSRSINANLGDSKIRAGSRQAAV